MESVNLINASTKLAQAPCVADAYLAAPPHHSELNAYKSALEELAIVAMCDRSGRITYVNDQFCRISGYDRSELIGAKHSLINSGHHPREFFKDMWRTIAHGRRWRGEICNRAKNGEHYWVDTTIAPMFSLAGHIQGYVSIRFDITRSKAVEAALTAEAERRGGAEALLRDIVEAIPDGVATFDRAGKLVLYNRAFRDFYAIAAPAISEGASNDSIIEYAIEHGQFATGVAASDWIRTWRSGRQNPKLQVERPLLQQLSDGRWLQMQDRYSMAGRLVTISTDVTSIKDTEQLIKRQAEQDPLTGLANRTVFQHRLTQALDRHRRKATMGAILLIDLDKFKDVNDTLGHDAGDALLVEIGRRLSRSLRRGDVVARLGGDEFAVIMPNVASRDDLIRLIGRIQADLCQPVRLARKIVNISCSIGIVIFPRDGRSPKVLLKNADIALYEAKARGRNAHCFFQPALRAHLKRRDSLTDALRTAIAGKGLDIALQPQVNLADGRHAGFEVLARWRNGGQSIAPNEFIPVGEESGLMVPLGNLILEKAASRLRDLRTKGLAPGFMAINVSAAQLKADGFVDHLTLLLARNGLDPCDVEIEVTEKVLFDKATSRITQTLFDLHALGFKIALDDFGTGYASLAHLKRFPVSRLKIDQSFVGDMTLNPRDSAIAIAIIHLAHNLDMDVVAEGIETREQFDVLKQYGCDFGQGYLLGRPLVGDDVDFYLSNISK